MEKIVTVEPDGRTLMEILAGQFYELPSFCAGRGTCGKCRVKVIRDGEESVELACQFVPEDGCQVVLLQEDTDFYVETWEVSGLVTEDKSLEEECFQISDWCSIAGRSAVGEGIKMEEQSRYIVVDIGTTTIAMLLLDGQGEILADWTGLNPQRRYGADVISRIEKAGMGQEQELTDCIRQEVLGGITALCRMDDGWKAGGQTKIVRVVIAGNTTMQHLFAGYSVDGLGAYPFRPFRTDLVVGKLTEFYSVLPERIAKAEYVLMPCISAFVGGDIMAGMLETERQEKERQKGGECRQGNWLLLDIGTNGEMVLYSEGTYYTASTAAGPVFEGGNISCGTGSVAGAIDHVWVDAGELDFTTIGGKAPVGICGTGLIDSIAALREIGVLDREGLLRGYLGKGYLLARSLKGELIKITQEDVRQFQLAKAAIRVGMELLCKTAGIEMQKLDRVYLAGGFGTKLDVAKSCEIGLLPGVVRKKCRVLGNASLKGCRIYCMEKTAKRRLEEMKERSREVALALEEGFQKQYLEYMRFCKDIQNR